MGSPRMTSGILECASEHTGGKNLTATHGMENISKHLAGFSPQHHVVVMWGADVCEEAHRTDL